MNETNHHYQNIELQETSANKIDNQVVDKICSEEEEYLSNYEVNSFLLILKQVRILLWKNFIIFKRNYKTTLFQFITPIAVCLLLFFLQRLTLAYTTSFKNKIPKTKDLRINKCTFPEDCITVAYSLSNYDYNSKYSQKIQNIEDIMKEVASISKLEYNKDIVPLYYNSTLSSIKENKYVDLSKVQSIYMNDYLTSNKNKTQYGVVFCVDSLKIEIPGNLTSNNNDKASINVKCEFNSKLNQNQMIMYNIYYNYTNSPNELLASLKDSYPMDHNIIKLKTLIDTSIIRIINNNKITKSNHSGEKINDKYTMQPTIDVKFTDFPQTENRFFDGADITSSQGVFYFFFVPITSFVLILLDIVKEKCLNLRKSLNIIGTKNISYWIHWYITGFLLSILVSIILLGIGNYLKFKFFTKTPTIICFMLFFSFTLSMQVLAFFISTIVKSLKSAYTASYSVILIGLIMQSIFSNPALFKVLYTKIIPKWAHNVIWLFEFYPPFNFSKIYHDICDQSCSHFDNYEWKWVEGKGYNITNFFNPIEGKLQFSGYYKMPATSNGFYNLFFNIIFFSFMTYYFDNVNSSNQGKSRGLLFFVKDFMAFVFGLIADVISLVIRLLSYCFNICNRNQKNEDELYSTMNHKSRKISDDLDDQYVNSKLSLNEIELVKRVENQANEQKLTIIEKSQYTVIQEKVKSIKISKLFNERTKNSKLSILDFFSIKKPEIKKNEAILNVVGIGKTYILNSFYYLCNNFYRIFKIKIEENSKLNNSFIKAVKEINFNISKGEVFALLGHNGAGKTTLINILTGHIFSGNGEIQIYGNTVNKKGEIEDLIEFCNEKKLNSVFYKILCYFLKGIYLIFRPLFYILKDNGSEDISYYMGLCPQHDILYEELTCEEHLILYANLRNYKGKIKSLVEKKLQLVNLKVQSTSPTYTLSGGMKRRLSIILSTIGNSKILFLDEPTTGLDPVNKRKIWTLVNQIKSNRAILLTSHSMDEADFLADRIGIMSKGEFKCIGTSLELKNIYGDGYLLNFKLKNNIVDNMIEELDNNIPQLSISTVEPTLLKFMPSLKLVSNLGGNLIYNLPFESYSELSWFIRILNKDFNKYSELRTSGLSLIIDESSMEYTSLEEIFLKVEKISI